jgi:hypothetical protein
MSKTITSNSRTEEQLAILHLFEFDMYDFNGDFVETLRFTDHDIFVDDGTHDYTPLAITFDALKEDITMTADSITIAIDNVSGALSYAALNYEWRNNDARIYRVVYTPKSDTIDTETYEFGYGDNLNTYPELVLSEYTYDRYTLFEGIIDTFNATEQTLSGTLTNLFINWQKTFPPRNYNQNEFASIVNAMTDSVYWGREKEE